jgi:4'-phosphopantetheinyl transferase
MIHWLVQSADSYPSSPDGVVVLDGVLHPREQARLATLKTEKRRKDWLLGRWTAKLLIGEVVAQETGEKLPFDAIEVRNGAMGDPIVNCQIAGDPWSLANGQREVSNLQSLISLSISHSNNHAFCALVEKAAWPLGADIECIESRSAEFVTDYFTKEEQALVAQASEAMQDVAVTAVWSAKEAVLKALHLGLTVDTRSVTCLIEVGEERPLSWTPFTIQCDNTHLPQAAPPLTGWWRTYQNFVLTLVVRP